ncbi:MAG: helix-turn-helix domain-containing protein [Bacteriovoracaceae bacterium]|nr:helix-turn-helix domain-containing protein [Bacteriovoracaceae bacterium]
MKTESPWMTIPECATYLRLSVTSIRRLIKSKKLEASRMSNGRVIRIHRIQADAYFLGYPKKLTRPQRAVIKGLQ